MIQFKDDYAALGAIGEGPPAPGGTRLPVARIATIARLPEEERWLIDGFLTRASITVLASTPKAGKTFVTLGLAVGVASGTPALGRFHVPSPGPVLLYHAEDDPRAIRERIESICMGAGVSFDALPIHIITADALRIDDTAQRQALEGVIAELRPKLLVLDPLVRLHAGAESYVGHMAELFATLRVLQRKFQVAILMTHHVTKNRAGSAQPGQAMRGSGDIHAAYDHGATLDRQRDGSVILSLEHRSAASPAPLSLRIVSREGATTFELGELEVGEGGHDPLPSPQPSAHVPARTQPTLPDRIVALLRASPAPLSQVALRRALRVRNETITQALRAIHTDGLIENLGRMGGWRVREVRSEPR